VPALTLDGRPVPLALLFSSTGSLLAIIVFVFDTGLMYSSYAEPRYEERVTAMTGRRFGRERAS
jgi:hypothetical protein